MSIKKSKVIRVTSNGTWEGKFGLMYKFEIEMENGDIGENLSKSSECKFKEGQETEYDFTSGEWPKIKPVNNFVPQSNNSTYSNKKDDVQHYIINQSSMDRAVTLAVGRGEFDLEVIKKDAERISNWVVTYKPETDLPF